MSDFGMAPTNDGLTPKVGRTGNLDAITLILGQGSIMGKERIQEFFNCVGNLSLDALQKKYTSVMICVYSSRSRFLSCMYIHDKFMTESR